MSSRSPSARLVEEVVALVGGPGQAATALHVTRQHVARVLAGGSALGIIPTVRAAILVGRNPVKALRDAGEEEAAEVLPQAFGAPVTVRQRKFWDKLEAARPSARRHLLALVDELPPAQAHDPVKR